MLIVYTAVLTVLLATPAANAIALIVAVALTVSGPVYRIPTVALGVVVPSSVYRIDAPAVVVLSDASCADV
jgi:hypothetical protein